jgi:hypothetical protein
MVRLRRDFQGIRQSDFRMVQLFVKLICEQNSHSGKRFANGSTKRLTIEHTNRQSNSQ